jgi:hypothetical protein
VSLQRREPYFSRTSKRLLLTPQKYIKILALKVYLLGVILVISEFGRTERTGLHLHISNIPPLPTANNQRNFILAEVR